MARIENRLVFLCIVLLAAMTALAGATAAASAAPPALKFEKRQPKTALLGTKQSIELFAENPEAPPSRGYNLSFRDVLPVGVGYVAGSASVAPSAVIADKPAKGETTLIFENVSDLSGKSSFAVNFEVEPSKTIFKISGQKTYTDKAQAFISEKPRKKPNFNKTTGAWLETTEEKAVIAKTESSATTELTAIRIEKSEPSPEGEILRGVHEHQTVYTLTVKNNGIGPTEGLTGQGAVGKSNKSIIVEDWLPAGLEFLGCGKADNTTNTETNPGSAEEYPGAGKIDPGNAPTIEGCVEPFYVKTEAEVTPPGAKTPKGTYTHVKWEGPESIATSGEFKIRYVAAIPLLKNTASWLGAEPAPEGGGVKQIANLNNNRGAANGGGETVDEELLRNDAQARGRYEAIEVKDNNELDRTAEDLAIQKGTNPTQTAIFDGAETNWTLRLETSEYRRSEPVTITDQLPDGLCPIGPRNYENPKVQPKPECAASATRHPTVRYLKGGPAGRVGSEEQIEYSLAEEEAAGGFKLRFQAPEVEALERLEPSQELLITFPTTTRVFYQQNYEDAKPILTGDSWTNKVSTEAPSFTRCYVEKAPGSYEADPNCEKPGTKPVASVRADGAKVTDASEAGQKAGGIKIRKTVRKNLEGQPPGKCEDPSSDYVKGLLSEEAALPKYRPGDEVCWRLVVEFPGNIYAGSPTVTDFIPTDQELIKGSEVEGPANNVVSELNKTAEKEELLEWELGGTSKAVEASKTFEVRFRTKMVSTTTSEPGEISGNLMKVTYANSEGVTFPLRDRSEVVREEPNLELKKKVVGSATVEGGKQVKFAIELPNTTGTLAAEEIKIWDELPEGLECGVNVNEITGGGKCEGTKRIVWEPSAGITVEAGKTGGPLTYVATIPSDVAPGHKYENTAGVVEFKSKTNTGGQYTYIPEKNINPGAGTPNTGPAKATAVATTTVAKVEKSATTETTQAGNSTSQATIGETVRYTVTAIVPAKSELYKNATLSDEIPAGLELVGPAGGAKVKLGSEESPPGFTVSETTENGKVFLKVKFPETFTTGTSASEVVLTFRAKVRNVVGNHQGVSIENLAKLTFGDKYTGEPDRFAESKIVATPLVEPELRVSKKQSIEPSEVVRPGDQVTYTIGAEDAEGRSTANNVVLVDTVPLGMKIVGSTEGGTYDPVARTITWVLPTVEPGALKAANTRKYTLEVENPAKAASVFNNKVVGTTQSMPTGEGPGRTAAESQGSTAYESSATRSSHLVGATIAKTVKPETGTIGTPLTYVVTMNLPPSIEYFNTTVVDTLPDGVAFDRTLETKIVETEGGSTTPKAASEITAAPEGTPQRFGWYFGSLAPSTRSRELIVEFEGHIKGKKSGGEKVEVGASLTNSAVGLYNGEDKGKATKVPTPGAGSGFAQETSPPATATTKVVEPAITIAKSVKVEPGGGAGPRVQPGGALLYKIVVANAGNAPAYDVRVTDTNPGADLRNVTPAENPEATVLSTKPLVWEIPGPIPAKGTVTLEYAATLAPSGELHNGDEVKNVAAIPVAYGVPKAERKEGVEYRTYSAGPSTVTLNVALPELALKKTAGAAEAAEAEARIGQPFPWQIEVSDKSTVADAKAVNVFDTLPEGWEYVKGSSKIGGVAIGEPTVAGGVLEWATNRSLPHGTFFKLTFEAKPTTALVGAPGSYVNQARTTGRDLSGAAASADGPYVASGEARAKLKVPSLGIVKTPDEGPAVAGKDASYSIAVTNSGEAEATEVEVTDVLGAGNEYTAGKATASPSTGFKETAVEPNTPGKGETTVHWKIASLPAAGKVTITVPVHLAPTIADGAKVSDLASVVSAEQPKPTQDGGSLKVSREADLLIEKSTAATGVVAGENIEYKLHVENKGPSEAVAAKVTDPVPAGTKLVSAGAPCAEVAGEVVCELGNLPLGFKADYKVVLKVLSGTTGSVVNKAAIASSTNDPVPGNDKSEVTTKIAPEPALEITKTGPAQPVLLGSTFEYQLTVTNNGPSDAVGVEIEDPLPPELELVSAEEPCGESAPTVVTCEFARLEPTQSETRHLTVKAIGIPTVAGAKVLNVAFVRSETEGETVHQGEAETLVLPAADLAITKTAPTTVEPDGTITYGLHVENHGPSIAHGVTVADPLPAGVDFVSASEGCAFVAAVVTCTLGPTGELPVGKAADFAVTVHVPYALGGLPLVNTATVKGDEADPVTTNDSSTVTTTVGPAADLSITKSMGKAEAGKPLTYTLAVGNKGPSAASAVTVTDTLPAGTTFKSAAPSQGACAAVGQDVTCLLGPLAAGGSAQISITVDVSPTAPATLRNVAKVEGPEPDPDRGNNESSVEGPVTPLPKPASAPLAPTAPNLKVVKTVSTSSPQVGTPFDYQVTVTNMGGAEAKNVKVLDTLNGPVKVVSIETESGRCGADGSKIECTIPSIPVGKTVHIDYSVIAEAAGPLSNTVSAQAANGEKAPSNNHAVKSVKARAGKAAAGAKASFTLTKTAAKKVVRGGKKVAFTITLRNGPTALVGATVCDRLPAALVFVKAAGASFLNGEACWQKKYVAAHRVLKLHLTARAVRGFKPRKATNVASARAENAPGAKRAKATVRIKPAFAGAPGGVTG